mgnify:CR=1 FL=1
MSDNVKKAIDSFENDKFTDAEEKIRKELKARKNDYLKKELGLEKDVETIEPDKTDDKDDKTDDDKEENKDDE